MKKKIKPILNKIFITLSIIPLLLISLTQTTYAFPHSPNDFLDPYLPSEFDTNGTIYMIETRIEWFSTIGDLTFRDPILNDYVPLSTFMTRFYYNRTLNDVAFLKIPATYGIDLAQVQFYTPSYEEIDDVGLILIKKTSTGLYLVFYDRESNTSITDFPLTISEVMNFNFVVFIDRLNYTNSYSVGYYLGFDDAKQSFGIYSHGYWQTAIEWAEYRSNIAYTLGYTNGSDEGYDKGYDKGYENTYQENFDRGFEDAGALIEVYHMPEWVVPLFILGFVVIIGLLVLGSKRGDE